MNDDWRLFREQEKYLFGGVLIKYDYRPGDASNDHDHCEFCMAKFGKATGDLKAGYSTIDCKIWICNECYEDFKEKFNWTVR